MLRSQLNVKWMISWAISLAHTSADLDFNLYSFSTHIRPKEIRSISYNFAYLISACVENFEATVALNILCIPVK